MTTKLEASQQRDAKFPAIRDEAGRIDLTDGYHRAGYDRRWLLGVVLQAKEVAREIREYLREGEGDDRTVAAFLTNEALPQWLDTLENALGEWDT